MKIKMSELRRIIKEEIEYAILEENVELEEGIGQKIAGALAGLVASVNVAGAIPVKVVDMRDQIVFAGDIKAKDANEALRKAKKVADVAAAEAGIPGEFKAVEATEQEVKQFKDQAGTGSSSSTDTVRSSSQGAGVQKIDDKTYKITGVNGDLSAANSELTKYLSKASAGKSGISTVQFKSDSMTRGPDGSVTIKIK